MDDSRTKTVQWVTGNVLGFFSSEFFCVHTLSLRVGIYILWFRLRVVLVTVPAMQHTE
jgi:hypothetical protein